MDPLTWRLVYPSGLAIDEPPDGASLRIARRGPVQLVVLRRLGEPVLRFDLAPGQRPVFYRQRSLGIDAGGTALDVTVFGRCWDGGRTIETDLYAGIDGQVVPCPAWAGDRTMVELFFEEFG